MYNFVYTMRISIQLNAILLQSRWRLLALVYGTRLTGFCLMHNSISSVKHSTNPIKFSIADVIKMYLNGPITSLQLKSLRINRKKRRAGQWILTISCWNHRMIIKRFKKCDTIICAICTRRVPTCNSCHWVSLHLPSVR